MNFREAFNETVTERLEKNPKFEVTKATMNIVAFTWSVIAKALHNGGLDDIVEIETLENGEPGIKSTPLTAAKNDKKAGVNGKEKGKAK